MAKIICTVCHKLYPLDQSPFRCECGGLYDFTELPPFINNDKGALLHGMLKYTHLFGLDIDTPLVSLGEGDTPLLPVKVGDNEIFLKMENMNPTGSYKDRGSAVLVSFLKSRGVTFAVEDSSGNAGASFAAYSARAGIKARIYVPASASGPKRSQIEMYGAELIGVPGERIEAAKAVMRAAESGATYGSHAFMPFGLSGIASIAYELVEQLGQVPGSIIVPVGHGGLLYGIMLGFESMVRVGYIAQEPEYIGVQSEGCSPIVEAFERKSIEIHDLRSLDTIAEGVKVSHPVRGKAILERLLKGKGRMISMSEHQIIEAYQQSARGGIFMEPTSALAWAAEKEYAKDFKYPAVAVITGSGLKSNIKSKME